MNGKSNNIISFSQVQSLEDALKKTLKEEIERLGIDICIGFYCIY